MKKTAILLTILLACTCLFACRSKQVENTDAQQISEQNNAEKDITNVAETDSTLTATPEPEKSEAEEINEEMTSEFTDEQKEMMASGTAEEIKDEENEDKNEAGTSDIQEGVADSVETVIDDSHYYVGDYYITVYPDSNERNSHSDYQYGTLTHVTYYSNTCEKERGMNILLPAGYTEEKKYPVLYVLHGIFGDEYSMCGDGKSGVPVLIGNLIAEGAAEEMIVVFPYMYASKTQDRCSAIDLNNVLAYDNFVNELADDIMPYMTANYSILEGKENSAITGFSMGGREALAIAFYRPDLFKYVGSIAPAPGLVYGVDAFMEHPGQFETEDVVFTDEKPALLMLCAGDKDSVVGKFPKKYHELFETNGVEHIWWEIPGSDHGDPAISSGIMNFVINIFK